MDEEVDELNLSLIACRVISPCMDFVLAPFRFCISHFHSQPWTTDKNWRHTRQIGIDTPNNGARQRRRGPPSCSLERQANSLQRGASRGISQWLCGPWTRKTANVFEDMRATSNDLLAASSDRTAGDRSCNGRWCSWRVIKQQEQQQ